MPRPRWAYEGGLVGLVFVLGVAALIAGLGAYGLWEPWEVDRIEGAIEHWGAGGSEEEDHEGDEAEPGVEGSLAERLIAASYDSAQEEAGLRLPGAVAALLTVIVGFFIGAVLFGVRPAAYASVVLVGIPVFLVTARLLLWSPFPILAHTLVVGGAALACFGRLRPLLNGVVGIAFMAAGCLIGYFGDGLVIGAATPLLAATLGLIVARAWLRGPLQIGVLVIAALAFSAVLIVVIDQGLLIPERMRSDPTFEELLKRTLLGTFPWTGLIVIGLGTLAHPEPTEARKTGAANVLLTSIGVSFGVQAIWNQQSPGLPLISLWPLAIGAGLLLESVERDERPRRLSALICALIMMLGLRDHLLDPSVTLVPLGGDVEWPERLKVWWWHALITLLLGVPVVLALARGKYTEPVRYREWFAKTFGWLTPRRSGGFTVRWIVAAVPSLLFVHSILAVLWPDGMWFSFMGCLERRIWIAAGCLIPAMIVSAISARAIWELFGRLGKWRALLTVCFGAITTLLSVHVAFPVISDHLSNRGVIRAYEQLANEGEMLYSYRASTSASELVGGPEIEEVSSIDALVRALTGHGKAFAVVRAEDLPRIDVQFRKRTEKHVPVADARSSSTLLIATTLSEEQDLNPLLDIVPYTRPSPSQPVMASFEERIELLGIDVVARGGRDYVCPADSFKVRYHWKSLRSVPGRKKVFVHIDGYGLRINGDHEPADGRYKVNDWQPGDYITDEQTLRVPLHFRPGDYTIFVGLFQGSKRMDVTDGPSTRDNRVKAGILKVR